MNKETDKKGTFFPERIVLEMTSRCNLSCDMCPRHHLDMNGSDMSADLWVRLINEISGEYPDAAVLPFWRGESLLHKQFVELMEFALDRNIKIHISTNGQILKDEQVPVLLRSEFITFSIHTDVGYKNALKFISMRKTNWPTVQISAVKGEDTENILRSIVKKPDLEGFDSVRIYEEHTKEGVFGKTVVSTAIPRQECPKLKDTLVIAYDGSVSRCNHIWITEELSVINMTIRDVWNSEVLQNIRESYPDEKCETCDQWTGHTCGESWKFKSGKVEHTKYGPAGVVNG
jgi:radical SAM protein with 4Fe4S-binding SPASM domain